MSGARNHALSLFYRRPDGTGEEEVRLRNVSLDDARRRVDAESRIGRVTSFEIVDGAGEVVEHGDRPRFYPSLREVPLVADDDGDDDEERVCEDCHALGVKTYLSDFDAEEGRGSCHVHGYVFAWDGTDPDAYDEEEDEEESDRGAGGEP